MFYGKYGKPVAGGAVGGTPAAGAHWDVPHVGFAPLSPFTAIPIVHAGPSFAGPPHVDVPHAAKGPFVHGGPGGGKAFGKPYGKAGAAKPYAKGGFAKPYGKGGFAKPYGKGFGKY
ncbi:MAG: hypothetical protein ACOY94_24840 [Bacillota bacterium]